MSVKLTRFFYLFEVLFMLQKFQGSIDFGRREHDKWHLVETFSIPANYLHFAIVSSLTDYLMMKRGPCLFFKLQMILMSI